jgi:hypothetical protein
MPLVGVPVVFGVAWSWHYRTRSTGRRTRRRRALLPSHLDSEAQFGGGSTMSQRSRVIPAHSHTPDASHSRLGRRRRRAALTSVGGVTTARPSPSEAELALVFRRSCRGRGSLRYRGCRCRAATSARRPDRPGNKNPDRGRRTGHAPRSRPRVQVGRGPNLVWLVRHESAGLFDKSLVGEGQGSAWPLECQAPPRQLQLGDVPRWTRIRDCAYGLTQDVGAGGKAARLVGHVVARFPQLLHLERPHDGHLRRSSRLARRGHSRVLAEATVSCSERRGCAAECR